MKAALSRIWLQTVIQSPFVHLLHHAKMWLCTPELPSEAGLISSRTESKLTVNQSHWLWELSCSRHLVSRQVCRDERVHCGYRPPTQVLRPFHPRSSLLQPVRRETTL